MTKLTFYIQTRVDGGQRTGLEVDGETVFGRFESGGTEPDPALLWYVDIRCRGEKLPTDPEAAKQWLLGQGELLSGELRKLSEELQVGLDNGFWPLQRPVAGVPGGAEITIVCSSIKRVASRKYGEILAGLSRELAATIRSLPRLEPVG